MSVTDNEDSGTNGEEGYSTTANLRGISPHVKQHEINQK